MSVRIQWRRDTAAAWTAADPTLANGEAGKETDTGKWKLGDGVTAWNALGYQAGDEAALSASYGRQKGWVIATDPQYAGGVQADGVTDDRAALVAAIAAAESTGAKRVILPAGAIKVSATIQTTASLRDLVIEGHGAARALNGGTELKFHGTGPLFQMGTNDGLPETDALYNGPQGLTLRNLAMSANAGTEVALAGGGGATYFTGTQGVKDYRGGTVILEHVFMERFETGFYGINSDFDRFLDVTAYYCDTAYYLGPRTDQFLGLGVQATVCNRALDINGARGVTFEQFNSINCGSPTVNPMRVRGASAAVAFVNPWLELDSGTGPTGNIEAWFEIGEDSATAVGGVTIIAPHASSGRVASGSINQMVHLLKIANIDAPVVVENPTGVGIANLLTSFTKAVGTYSGKVFLRGAASTVGTYTLLTNAGTGAPKVLTEAAQAGFAHRRGPIGATNANGGSGYAHASAGSEVAGMFEGNGGVTLGISGTSGQMRYGFYRTSALDGWVGYDHSNRWIELGSTGSTRARVNAVGLTMGGTVADLGTGIVQGPVIGLANAVNVPASNPVGGGVLYVEAGALKYRGSGGTVTTLGPA